MKPQKPPSEASVPSVPSVVGALGSADAKAYAQQIAFGPLLFQAVAACRRLGVFDALWETRRQGATAGQLAERLSLSKYAVTVLCQATAAGGVLDAEGERYRLSKVGYHLHKDALTQANFDFVRDVCYAPARHLTEALEQGVPSGLSELTQGDSATVYEALNTLPHEVQRSWYDFDHFYSDAAFDAALPYVLAADPKRVVDVGANTGRFSMRCLARHPKLRMVLVDHEQQLTQAAQSLSQAGHAGRFETHALDLATRPLLLPPQAGVVWLSQLLDCFGETDVVAILSAAAQSLEAGGQVMILEPCWDVQEHVAGSFCLLQTSLYFSCVANGRSRMYDTHTLETAIAAAGLHLHRRVDGLGVGHSLFICRAPQ